MSYYDQDECECKTIYIKSEDWCQVELTKDLYYELYKEKKKQENNYYNMQVIVTILSITFFIYFLYAKDRISIVDCNAKIKEANNIIFSLREEIEDAKYSLWDDYDTLYSKIDWLTLPDSVDQFTEPSPPDGYEEECVWRYC